MEKISNYLLRRRHRINEQKRAANLIRNSNCVGTTADLFRQQPHRILTRDVLEQEKSSLLQTVNFYK